MEKVQIVVCGRDVMVDADQESLHIKKWKLIEEGILLQSNERSKIKHTDENIRLCAIASKIMSLNRRIRKNVQFI